MSITSNQSTASATDKASASVGDGSLQFYGAKLGAIGLNTAYFLALGVAFSAALNRTFPVFDEAKYRKKHTAAIIAEIVLQAAMIGVCVYFCRQIIKRIPYPLEDVGGFRVGKLKENGGGVLMAFAIMLLQGPDFGSKIKLVLSERMNV